MDLLPFCYGRQKYWATLDAASAYWAMPIEEKDKEKTAFSVKRGKFEFNVTSFGLCNAGPSYQRLMDLTLSGLPPDRLLGYMDDVIVFTKTFEQHMTCLRMLLDKLVVAGIQLKATKCIFGADKVDFLGFQLSEEGIRPQSHLTDAVKNFATPTKRKEVRRFLGLAGYYRNFIPEFATISYPLNRLTSVNVEFTWSEECEKAFNELKKRLITKPVLAFPKFNEEFIVEIDASGTAIGGVLHPIAYFSKALSASQQKWSVYTQEAYAMVSALHYWYVYLCGNKFTLNSDHNSLVYL